MRSLIILLLVAFVAGASARKVFNVPSLINACCGKDATYQPGIQGCCGGRVYNTSSGELCCNNNLYNPANNTCCGFGSSARVAAGLGTCCQLGSNFVTYNNATQICCTNGALFPNPPTTGLTTECCGASLTPVGFGCCGGRPYNLTSNKCCFNKGIIGAGLACCETPSKTIIGYNDTNSVCCNGVPVPANISSTNPQVDQACCAGRPYNFRKFGCCGSQTYDLTNSSCCNNQVINSSLSCCEGRIPYDSSTRRCCDTGSAPFIAFNNESCCGNTAIPTTGFDCCAGQPYNTSVSRCCGNAVIPNTLECCTWGTNPVKGAGINITVQTCCNNGPVAGGPTKTLCCGGVAHDGLNQICCEDTLTSTLGLTLPACCGKKAYDSFTSLCCANSELYLNKTLATHQCCGSKKFNPNKKTCCRKEKTKADGTIVIKEKVRKGAFAACCGTKLARGEGDSCCGADRYFSGTQVCCGGKVFDGNKCCDDKGYSSFTHICCKNKLFNVPENGINQCCGKKVFDTTTQICCPPPKI